MRDGADLQDDGYVFQQIKDFKYLWSNKNIQNNILCTIKLTWELHKETIRILYPGKIV